MKRIPSGIIWVANESDTLHRLGPRSWRRCAAPNASPTNIGTLALWGHFCVWCCLIVCAYPFISHISPVRDFSGWFLRLKHIILWYFFLFRACWSSPWSKTSGLHRVSVGQLKVARLCNTECQHPVDVPGWVLAFLYGMLNINLFLFISKMQNQSKWSSSSSSQATLPKPRVLQPWTYDKRAVAGCKTIYRMYM